MDLVLGVAYAGYHLWKHRRRPRIEIDTPYLLNIPPEIRLVIYDFLFDEGDDDDDDETRSPAEYLEPLLTCRLIHDEAYPKAFARANFFLVVKHASSPFWTPQILTLPARKLRYVRKIIIHWDTAVLDVDTLRRFFNELAYGPLNLSRLTFTVRNPHCLAPFRFQFALFFPGNRDFAKFATEELPLMDNVQKVVFTSPSIEKKRYFQYFFDPKKPGITADETAGGATLRLVKKKLGDWDYNVIRCGEDVRTWRLELTHPALRAGASAITMDEDGT
jgi:hypothetical protein